jgi:anti-sigma B factor antagonist
MDPGSVRAVSVSTADGGVLDVALRGEIDYLNAGQVAEVLDEAVRRQRPNSVRIDMSEVTFLDSSGIAVLVKGMKAARAAQADYLVARPVPKVFDQLRMTGLTELFPVEAPSAEEAAGAS